MATANPSAIDIPENNGVILWRVLANPGSHTPQPRAAIEGTALPDDHSNKDAHLTVQFDFDVAVIGAGAIGLAIAHQLAHRGGSVVVLEREAGIGRGVSSRSSEVVHAGLYYPDGTLRARLCVEGRRKLYAFLDAHKIDYCKYGKFVVATNGREEEALSTIADQAERNGVESLAWLNGAEARSLEPELTCVAALSSPETGIFDSHGFMLALAGEILSLGGALALRAPFVGATPRESGGFTVRTGGRTPTKIETRALVIASGLDAQTCAGLIEGYPPSEIPRRHLGKGNYFRIEGPAPFRRLIYPPPIPGALGIHYTLDLAGRPRFGPDLSFEATEDYEVDAAGSEHFYCTIRRYWPRLKEGALKPDYAGIRPKIHGPGEAQSDFRIDGVDRHGFDGLVTLFGIESPGLTASLAIGSHVAEMLFAGLRRPSRRGT